MHFLDLLFPKQCLSCGKWGKYICLLCKKEMKPPFYLKCPVCEKPAVDGMTHPKCRTKYTLDGLTSFFRYERVVKKAIKEIKYRYAFDIIGELIDCIPNSSFEIVHNLRTMNHELRTLLLIPVPLHRSRYNFRGFNQAGLIARALGIKLKIPVKNDVLIRRRMTTPQVEMEDRDMRLANMKNVFQIHEPQTMNHKHGFFLVDDVFTTGATLRSAASALKRGGAKFVWGITLAQ